MRLAVGQLCVKMSMKRDTGGPKLFPIWSTEGPKTIYKVGQLLPYDNAEYGITVDKAMIRNLSPHNRKFPRLLVLIRAILNADNLPHNTLHHSPFPYC